MGKGLYQQGYDNGYRRAKEELSMRYRVEVKFLDTLIERAYNDLVRRKVLRPNYCRGMRNTVLSQINIMRSDLHRLHADLCDIDVSDHSADFLNCQESACQIVADALALCKLAYVTSDDIIDKMDLNDTLEPEG